MVTIGLDEAGRGPVLGSMFIGITIANVEDLPEEVDDSKNLTTNRIHELASQLRSNEEVRTGVVEVTPQEIDSADSLTDLTARRMATLIDEYCQNEWEEVLVDSCTQDEETFGQTISGEMVCSCSLTSEHSADETYPIVSAASIIAKSNREEQVERLNSEFGSVGSGYPSDPTTREYLESFDSIGELPDFVRKSWSTVEDLVAEPQKPLSEF